MKRILLLLLILALCLTGCKKQQADIPGSQEVPEDIDWKLWEQYTPASLTLGEETVDVLITMDAIHLAVYYDQEKQELLGSLTITEPLTDVEYSQSHLRILDQNGDGYDDICIPDLLESGDRTLNWWFWDAGEKIFRYAPDETQYQEAIAEDISWMDGKDFISATMETPEGPRDLLIQVEGQQVFVYLDDREENLMGTAHLPKPLTEEALEHLEIYTYWECQDLDGDGWGDLQVPCRWEEEADGTLFQYGWCFLWNPSTGSYTYDALLSHGPMM